MNDPPRWPSRRVVEAIPKSRAILGSCDFETEVEIVGRSQCRDGEVVVELPGPPPPEFPDLTPDYNPIPKEVPEINTDPDPESPLPSKEPEFPGPAMPSPPDPMIPKEVSPGPTPDSVPRIPPDILPPDAPSKK
ncbi:hypothetical protein ACFE04_007598 [Oxalis oulophora]